MVVYIDADFHCHVKSQPQFTPVESVFFDGKCQTFIEGYRFVPEGKTWQRSDGAIFSGEMITPFKDLAILQAAQTEYERTKVSMENAYREGVNSV